MCEQEICDRGWCPFIYVYDIAWAGVIFGISRVVGIAVVKSHEAKPSAISPLSKTSGIYPRISRLPVLQHINTMASSLSNTPFSALLQATQRGRYITFFTLVGDISRRQVIFHVGR